MDNENIVNSVYYTGLSFFYLYLAIFLLLKSVV